MTLKQTTFLFSILALLVILTCTFTFQGYRNVNTRLLNMVILLESIKLSAFKISSEVHHDQPDTQSIKERIKTIPKLSRQFQDVWGLDARPSQLIELEISFVRVGRMVDKSLPGETMENPLREQIEFETIRIEKSVDSLLDLSQKKIAALKVEAELMILFLAIALIAYIAGVLVFLSRKIIRPVRSLSEQIEDVRSGSRQNIVSLSRKDEIGRLYDFAGKAINELAQKNAALKHEINEREDAEDLYRQSATTLENVLNSTNPLCITNTQSDLVLANASYYELWPKKAVGDEAIKCYDSRPGALCHTDECPLQQIKQGKEVVRVETTKIEGDGRESYFIITARPFRDDQGNLIGMVESFQDISVRRLAEEARDAERERLAATLRSIGEGVITINNAGRIILFNKIAEQLTGWTQPEAFERPLAEVFQTFSKQTREKKDYPLETILQSGKVTIPKSNIILIDKEGAEREIAMSSAPIKKDYNERAFGVVLAFRDVTEENRMKQELLKAKKLESIGVLAGGIAHDFNNILTGIMGNIHLASLYIEPDQEAHELLREAGKASKRAKGLTQQLLTFSKGGAPVRKISSITELVKDSANFVLRGGNIKCDYHLAPDLWPANIDNDQISQVIQNIILNASHAMPQGGTITISCENYRQNEDNPLPIGGERLIKIAITDQGEGISPEIREKIFDPYFSTKSKGSGLGLAISHSIITKHGGLLTVDSEENNGSTFTIYLTAAEEYEKIEDDITSKIIADKSKNSGTILIMDDEIAIRNLAEAMLTQYGYKVLLASDGKEAINLFKNNKDNIVLTITDLTVPGGMGGKEMATEILKIKPEAKIIVSSGYSNNPIMACYKDYGFAAAICKPYDVIELMEVIQQTA